MQNSKFKIQKIKVLIFILLSLIFAGTAKAQDFGIYDLSAKTNLDSADIFMISQRVDSAYYKVLWDRVVDSIEDSIKGNIINAWIKSGANIALNKLASGTAGYIVMANVSGVPTYTAVSGDGTISNAGVLTISSNAIGSSEITDGSIVNADVNSSAAIVYSKLSLTNSIVSGDITDGTITTNDILDGTITTNDISDGTITNTDISTTAAISVSKLAPGTKAQIPITSNGDPGTVAWRTVSGDITIDQSGVTALATNAIVTANITDGNVTSAKLEDEVTVQNFAFGVENKSVTSYFQDNAFLVSKSCTIFTTALTDVTIEAVTGVVGVGEIITFMVAQSSSETITLVDDNDFLNINDTYVMYPGDTIMLQCVSANKWREVARGLNNTVH